MPEVGRDFIQARGLNYDTYCAACGYNLRTRPRFGKCPECGNEYDARPLGFKGLLEFTPPRFPFSELWHVLLAGIGAGVCALLAAAGSMRAWWAALPFVVAMAIFLYLALRQGVRWWHGVRILREVRRSTDEDGDSSGSPYDA
jgi:hypothetical protein